MSDQPSEVSLHFLDYWRVVRNRAPIIITIFLLTFMTGYIKTVYYTQKIYGATAEIKVQKKEKDIPVFDHTISEGFDPVFFQAENEIIKSKTVLYPVINKLNLTKAWAKKFYGTDQELRSDQVYGILLGSFLEIEPKRGSNLIEITGKSDDPKEASVLANAVAQGYIDYRKSEEAKNFLRGSTNLEAEIEKQRTEVEKARAKVEELRKQYNIDSLGGGAQNDTQTTDQQLQQTMARLDEAKTEMVARQVRYDELQKLSLDQLIDTLPALGLEDSNLTSIRQQELDVETAIEALLKKGYGEDHPQVQTARAQLKKLHQQVLDLVDGKRNALGIDLKVSKSKLDQLEKDVDALREKARLEKTEKIVPFQEAKTDLENKETLLQNLELRLKQERIDSRVDGDPVIMISPAEPNEDPILPKKFLNFAISGTVGLILGLALAFFVEYLDTSVKTMDDVEKFLGIPVLAVIPDGVTTLNLEGPDSPHAEGYRILRAKIDLTPKETGGNTITMLSGGPGEGKSTTVFNLAFVCAQSGQSVLLIDADLRRPTLHNILGLPNRNGVADVFLGKGEAYEFIQPTNFPNLHVITAGDMPFSKMGAFSALRLREMLDDLKQRYDVVLLDAPPVLGISDGSVIAHECDITLLVIQHRRYPRDISLRAKRAVEEVKGNLVGVVLNAVSIKSDEAYYYYSSYGNYYSGYGNRSEEKKGKPGRKAALKPEGSRIGSDSF